jgi:hypothetical protein
MRKVFYTVSGLKHDIRDGSLYERVVEYPGKRKREQQGVQNYIWAFLSYSPWVEDHI